MITKNELKYFSALLKKKIREKEKKFVVEGEKIVEEGLKSSFKCERIIVTHEFYEKKQDYLNENISNKNLLGVIKNQEFNKISDTVNSQGIAAFFQIPKKNYDIEEIKTNIAVCLDNISDPGNVGTIFRNCDWFGINEIFLTEGCAEVYNPKTIRASMGSIFHLNIFDNINLSSIFNLKKKNYKIITADIKGENIYNFNFPSKAVLIFSNETSGPGMELLEFSDNIITIPKSGNAESLNVASASAVILSQLRNA